MNEKKRTSCYRDARGRPKARGHFAMPRKTTPKDGVVAKYPNAMCTRWVTGFIVTTVEVEGYLGKGPTPALAWSDAKRESDRNDLRRELRARLALPRSVGRPATESKYDSELDAMENG